MAIAAIFVFAIFIFPTRWRHESGRVRVDRLSGRTYVRASHGKWKWERSLPRSVLAKIDASIKIYEFGQTAYVDAYNGSDWMVTSWVIEVKVGGLTRRYEDDTLNLGPSKAGISRIHLDERLHSEWTNASVFDRSWSIASAKGYPGD